MVWVATPTIARCFLEEPVRCNAVRLRSLSPPSGARTCQNFSDCAAGEVCTVPLSSSATTLATYCVPAQPGAVDASMPCTSDTDCATYRCLQQTQGKFCMKACGADGVWRRSSPSIAVDYRNWRAGPGPDLQRP